MSDLPRSIRGSSLQQFELIQATPANEHYRPVTALDRHHCHGCGRPPLDQQSGGSVRQQRYKLSMATPPFRARIRSRRPESEAALPAYCSNAIHSKGGRVRSRLIRFGTTLCTGLGIGLRDRKHSSLSANLSRKMGTDILGLFPCRDCCLLSKLRSLLQGLTPCLAN